MYACIHSSVHANSPILCSFRSSLNGECESDFKDIPKCICPVFLSYISVTTGKSLCNGIFTTDFKKLIHACDDFRNVVITGPSGCGKSYALVSLFALCVTRGTPCVLLSSSSFVKDDICVNNYCRKLLNEKDQPISIESVLSSLYDPSKSFMVFADFS